MINLFLLNDCVQNRALWFDKKNWVYTKIFEKNCHKTYHCSGVVCEAKSWCHLRQTWPTANNEISSRNLKIPIKTSGGKRSTTLSGRESPSFLGNDNWDNWWLRDSTRIGWNKINEVIIQVTSHPIYLVILVFHVWTPKVNERVLS